MHSVTGRLRAVMAALGLAVGLLLVAPTGSGPAAAAQECGPQPPRTAPRNCSHQGGTTGSGAAASATLSQLGGGRHSVPTPCSIDVYMAAGGPTHYEHYDPPLPGHIEVRVTPSLSMTAPSGNHDVWVYCVADEVREPHQEENGWPEDLLRAYFDIPQRTPEDLLEYALAQLVVGGPMIHTSPGDGLASMVGLDTWLMVDQLSWNVEPVTVGDDLLSVTVWARPDGSRQVIWDTGEDETSCPLTSADPASCSYSYERSSIGQAGRDAAGRPAYAVTASMTYIAGYAVYVGGSYIGGVDNIGNIDRTSPPYFLAVEEAQVINTRGT